MGEKQGQNMFEKGPQASQRKEVREELARLRGELSEAIREDVRDLMEKKRNSGGRSEWTSEDKMFRTREEVIREKIQNLEERQQRWGSFSSETAEKEEGQ